MPRDEILNWLLEPDNPPVRLLTLTRLLGRPETDAEVQDTRAHLMDYAVTQEILAHSDEIWKPAPRSFWSYKGKNWNTTYLGQFYADGQDSRIAPGVQALIEGRGWVLPNRFQCMTACLLTAFRRLGYGAHPIVVRETEALAQRTLAGQHGLPGIDCTLMNNSLLSHCYMALPKLLLCFAEIPHVERSPAQQAALDAIVAELLAREVYVYLPGNRKQWEAVRKGLPRKRADLPEDETRQSWTAKAREQFLAEHGMGGREPKRSWTRFGFPLNYNSDALEAMVALATAGAPKSAALEKPLQLIRDKRTPEGVWRLDKSFNGQMWADVEVKGEPSKWITFFALWVLGHFG